MLQWFQDHPVVSTFIVAASVAMFILGLVAAPFIVRRIPADYFTHDRRPPGRFARQHWLLRLVLLIFKNLLAVVLILAGIAMLVLPGQGLLTLLVGFVLLDLPGKYHLEKRLTRQRNVHKTINWLRQRKGIAPLKINDAAK